jgi:hypothetical protein
MLFVRPSDVSQSDSSHTEQHRFVRWFQLRKFGLFVSDPDSEKHLVPKRWYKNPVEVYGPFRNPEEPSLERAMTMLKGNLGEKPSSYRHMGVKPL